MYQDGRGYVGDEIVEGSTVFVLGQNPGADEEREGRPFVGKSGMLMESVYFKVAGLVRGENVSIGNTLRCRLILNGKRTNDLPPVKVLEQAVSHCSDAYLRVPESVRLIVAQGSVAWRALGGPRPITDWRGFLMPTPRSGAA